MARGSPSAAASRGRVHRRLTAPNPTSGSTSASLAIKVSPYGVAHKRGSSMICVQALKAPVATSAPTARMASDEKRAATAA